MQSTNRNQNRRNLQNDFTIPVFRNELASLRMQEIEKMEKKIDFVNR